MKFQGGDGNKRTEINFLRLLNRCECMVKGKSGSFDWRLEKYVGGLVDFLNQLKKMTANQPRHEDLIDYTRRAELLKGLMEAEKLPNPSLKLMAVGRLVSGKTTQDFCSNKDSKATRTSVSCQLLADTKAKCLKNMKEDLFGSSDASSRQRSKNSPEEDVSVVMKYHQQMQEKLADEMVNLARSLKENVSLAGKIVREDKEKLHSSTVQAEENFSKLKVESERLEYHIQRICSWWIWIMLVFVIITFVWMVVFMRLYPKSR